MKWKYVLVIMVVHFVRETAALEVRYLPILIMFLQIEYKNVINFTFWIPVHIHSNETYTEHEQDRKVLKDVYASSIRH